MAKRRNNKKLPAEAREAVEARAADEAPETPKQRLARFATDERVAVEAEIQQLGSSDHAVEGALKRAFEAGVGSALVT